MQIPQSNSALESLKSGRVLNVYVTGNFATPRTVDFVCRSGYFDAIWFDLEHFDIPTQQLAVLNMIAKAHGITTVARIKASDYQVVMRTLETGVDGLMCAMVADADEARKIVQWAKFNNPNPAAGEAVGARGWNGGNIDACYGNFPAMQYVQYQNTQTMILCQIEYPEALKNAREIAAVPGVNGLFFGPGDYSTSLGFPGQIFHPAVREAMAEVARVVKAEGKWWGTVAVGREMYCDAVEMGAQFICPGGDVKIMNVGLRELVKTIHPEAPAQ